MTASRDRAQRTIDAAFREHGVPATYIAGSSTPCTVIVSDEDRNVQFAGTSKPFAAGGRFEIRASEISAPVKDGIIALLANEGGAESSRHKIVGDPETDDPFRLVWLCTVRSIAS
jgi:hypothetical protein